MSRLVGLGAIGKGLEKKTGSLSSSLGISEYEVGSFNKSVVFANDTPTKCTKSSSTMSSSQEMQINEKISSWEWGYANQCFIASIYWSSYETLSNNIKCMIFWIHMLLSLRNEFDCYSFYQIMQL